MTLGVFVSLIRSSQAEISTLVTKIFPGCSDQCSAPMTAHRVITMTQGTGTGHFRTKTEEVSSFLSPSSSLNRFKYLRGVSYIAAPYIHFI